MPGTGVAGQPLECVLLGVNILADLGARLEDPTTRGVVVGWRPAVAGIDPYPAPAVTGGDYWRVTFPAAPPAGLYLLVWRTQHDPTLVEVIDAVTITGDSVGSPPAWRPTPTEVAAASYEYTRHAFVLDEPSAGSPHGVFDESTTPTLAMVDAMIAAACDEIQGRVGIAVPPRHHELARQTAIWHVAAFISQIHAPAGTQDQQGEYQTFIARYGRCVDDLVVLCREYAGTRLA